VYEFAEHTLHVSLAPTSPRSVATGEVFGLGVGDVDFLRKQLRGERQVEIVRGRLVIDRPEGGRTRTVPLPD